MMAVSRREGIRFTSLGQNASHLRHDAQVDKDPFSSCTVLGTPAFVVVKPGQFGLAVVAVVIDRDSASVMVVVAVTIIDPARPMGAGRNLPVLNSP